MGANDVRVTYIADYGDYKTGSAFVKNATKEQIVEVNRANAAWKAMFETQKLSAQVSNTKVVPAMNAATVSVVKLTAAQQQMKQVTRNLGYQIGDVANSVAAGQSFFAALGRQVLDVAGQFSPLTLAAKLFSPAGLAVAAAAAAAAATLYTFKKEAESLREEADRSSVQISKLGKAYTSFGEHMVDVQKELDKARGSYDEVAEAQKKLDDETKKHANSQRQQAAALFKSAEAAYKEADAHKNTSGIAKRREALDRLTVTRQNAAILTEEANRSEALALSQTAEAAKLTREQAAAEDRKTASRAASTAATRDAIAAEARMNAMVAEAGQKADEQRAAIDAKVAAQKEAEKASAAITAKAYKEAGAKREADTKSAAEAEAYKLDLMSSSAASVGAILDEVASRGGRAAKVAAIGAKAAAVFGIAINTAQAITKGFAIFGPPPSPAGIGAAIAATTIGASQAGLVASQPVPEFHTGRAYDEVPSTILRSERVLTATGARAVGGDKAVAAANRGQTMGGAVSASFILGHKVYDQQTRNALRLPGSSLAAALTQGRTVGHR